MKSKLYVLGDSFCFYRTDPQQHWPASLAEKLNLELAGEGLPGQTWWDCRTQLLRFMRTPAVNSVELFIFCHTEHNRIIGNRRHRELIDQDNTELEEFRKLYYNYLYNPAFNLWAVQQWFQELNSIIGSRPVIHIPGFDTSVDLIKQLNGVKITTPLMSLSQQENHQQNMYHDERCNHLSAEGNIQLAQRLYDIYQQYNHLDQIKL